MMQPIRTTISFSVPASMIINACEPQNLSDFVSKAVEETYSSQTQVIAKEFGATLARAQQLIAILQPDKEIIVKPKVE